MTEPVAHGTDGTRERRVDAPRAEERAYPAAPGSEVALVTAGPDRVVTSVTPTIENILGWLPADLVGTHLADLIHPDDRAATEGSRTAAYAGRDPSDGMPWVLRFRTATGAYRWLSVVIQPLSDADGRPAGITVALHDADDLVRDRERADNVEAYAAAILDSLLDPHVLLSAVRAPAGRIVDFRYAEANDAACAYVGVERPELIGSRLLERFPSHVESGLFAAYVMAVETGSPITLDAALIHSDLHPGPRYFDVRGVAIGDALTITWRDVTDRVTSTTELQRSERRYRLLAENTSDVVVEGDDEGRFVWVSDSITALVGWRPAEVIGVQFLDLVHPDDAPAVVAVRTELAAGRAGTATIRVRTAEGSWHWVTIAARGAFDEDGRPAGRVASWHDTQAEMLALGAYLETEAAYRFLVEHLTDVVFRSDADARFTWVSESVEALVGRDPASVVGCHVSEFVLPDDVASLERAVDAVLAGDATTFRGRVLRADGTTRWVSVTVQPILDEHGAVTGGVGSIRDIEELAQALATAERERAVAVATVDTFLDPHVVLEAVRDDAGAIVDFVFTDANDAACEYNRVPRSALIGRSVLRQLPERGARELLEVYREVVDTGRPLVLEDFEYPHELFGAVRRYDIRAVKLGDSLSFTWRDVTDRHDHLAELADLATHDRLTGLANRAAILDEITRGLAVAERSGRSVGVLLVDLDHFKNVNDSLGHAVGDELLIAAAGRLHEAVRSGDLVGRLGGDEFVVVVRDLVDGAEVAAAADRIIAAFRRPLTRGDYEFFSTASIGIAVGATGATADDLLREADTALYRAKDEGRDRWSLFNEDLRARAVDRLRIEAQLRTAVAARELELWYQPEIDLRSGEVVAVEALLRWRLPTGEVLTAESFIDVAEDSGLILEIGDWVLDEVCRQAAAWAQAGLPRPLTVRANLSTLQLAEGGLLEMLDDALARHGVDPTTLCFEITETTLMRETAKVRENLEGIRARGIHLALDDFGTGYASLSYLRDFPIHVVKIDRSFTAVLITDEFSQRLVAGIISLAALLGMQVTAEGVEDPSQARSLAAYGCTGAQGYLFSRAVPAEEIPPLLDAVYRW